MYKLNGKYTYEMAFDIANMVGDKDLNVGIYKNEPSVLPGSFDGKLDLISQTYDEYCNLYVSKELTPIQSQMINDLEKIKRTFSEQTYRGLRIGLESDIDEETRENTIFYSQYISGDDRYVLYHVPKEKALTKESK